MKNSNLKVVVVVLILAVIGGLGYSYRSKPNLNKVEIDTISFEKEKSHLFTELVCIRNAYNDEFNEKIDIPLELYADRDHVLKLIADLLDIDSKKNTYNVNKAKLEEIKEKIELLSYKKTVENVDKTLAMNLEEEKRQREYNRPSVLKSLREESWDSEDKSRKVKKVDTKNVKNEAIELKEDSSNNETINKEASKLLERINPAKPTAANTKQKVDNLKIDAFKIDRTGTQFQTYNSKEIDIIKIYFNIYDDSSVSAGKKDYYIQIFDSNHKLVNFKSSSVINNKMVDYTCKVTVNYENRFLKVTENMLANNFKKGIYFVKLLDQNDELADATFTLK